MVLRTKVDLLIFKDRKEAGAALAKALQAYVDIPNGIVIALPRGGVVVGAVVASLLHLPLDIISPRKIGAPFNPEFAIGAITERGEGIFSEEIIREYGISEAYVKAEIEKEKKVAMRRLQSYRREMPPRQLFDKTVIIVDDGIATGSTIFAAIKTVKAEGAHQIIVAVPVSPKETYKKLATQVSKVVVLATPSPFFAVGQYYEFFDQTSDEEVITLLQQAIQ